MAIFIESDPFLSIQVLRGVIRDGGGARSQLFLLPYLFESMYSHVYGVKWSPWSVPFEINYLREGLRILNIPYPLFFSNYILFDFGFQAFFPMLSTKEGKPLIFIRPNLHLW